MNRTNRKTESTHTPNSDTEEQTSPISEPLFLSFRNIFAKPKIQTEDNKKTLALKIGSKNARKV
jgi:hypothetical protein